MRLKSFYAKTMTEAMQMVRESLGEDAIIVATRDEDGGKSVRVTAALDDGFFLPRSSRRENDLAFELGRGSEPAPRDDWLQYDDEQDSESSLTEAIIDTLLRHGVTEDILDQIVNCASLMNVDDPVVAFVGAIDSLFQFTPLPAKSYRKPLMFVGPPGAGKTLTVAKLATRSVMSGLSVGVVTTDTFRAGGIEQLKAFTKILKVDLKTAQTAGELSKVLGEMGPKDQILIDSPGYNPFSSADIRALMKFTTAGDIEPVLVMPAAGDAVESGEIARVYAALGAHRMVPTRLDIARRLGGLLTAAQQGGLAFADSCFTPNVADGIEALSPRRLTSYFFQGHSQKPDSLRTPHSPSSPFSKKSTG